MAKRTTKTAKARLTNERMLGIIMQEIADVRMELKGDIAAMGHKLGGRIDGVAAGLTEVKTDLSGLRGQVHQNQVSFMSYMDRTDKRLSRVEAKVG